MAPASAPGSGGQITSAIYAVIFPDLRWTLCSAFHAQRSGGRVRIWYGAGRVCMLAQGSARERKRRVGEEPGRRKSRSMSFSFWIGVIEIKFGVRATNHICAGASRAGHAS